MPVKLYQPSKLNYCIICNKSSEKKIFWKGVLHTHIVLGYWLVPRVYINTISTIYRQRQSEVSAFQIQRVHAVRILFTIYSQFNVAISKLWALCMLSWIKATYIQAINKALNQNHWNDTFVIQPIYIHKHTISILCLKKIPHLRKDLNWIIKFFSFLTNNIKWKITFYTQTHVYVSQSIQTYVR